MTGKKWRFLAEHLGGTNRLVAEASDELSLEHAKIVAHLLSDDLRRKILVVPPGSRTPVSNPSLVAHGAGPASHHIVTSDAAHGAVADLYYLSDRTAGHIARRIATILREPVVLLVNRDTPARLRDHPGATLQPKHEPRRPNPPGDPQVGETWRRGGVNFEVRKVTGTHVWAYNRSTGNVDEFGKSDFKTGKLIRPRPNPKGRNVRRIRTLSPVAVSLTRKKEAEMKARVALERWLQGMHQGGHTASKADIAATYQTALEHYLAEPNPKARNNPGYWKAGDRFRLLMPVTTFNRHKHAKGELGTVTLGNESGDSMIYVVFDSTPKIYPEAIGAWWAEKIVSNPKRRQAKPKRPNPLPRWVDPRSIRTVQSGKALVRVGCPQGHYHPRAKGRKCDVGTRAVEVLTPVKTRRNPSVRERAARTFRKWHDFAPHRVTRMKGPDRVIPKTLVRLGDVVRIDYLSHKWEGRPVTYTHKTKRPRPVLVTDPDARFVHLVGGKMKVTADGLVN